MSSTSPSGEQKGTEDVTSNLKLLSVDVGSNESGGQSGYSSAMFSSAKKRKVPPAHQFQGEHLLGLSTRHCPEKDFVEPKVLSPHKTRPGQIPREIQVERKKRAFMQVDVTRLLHENGVIAHLVASYNSTAQDSMDSIPLSMYYNSDLDSRPIEMWTEMANQSYLKARALHTHIAKGVPHLEWKRCTVVGANDGFFNVIFGDDYTTSKEEKDPSRNLVGELSSNTDGVTTDEAAAAASSNDSTKVLHRLFVCFDAEEPAAYCEHLLQAMKRKTLTTASIALNLYVDCMPLGNFLYLPTNR